MSPLRFVDFVFSRNKDIVVFAVKENFSMRIINANVWNCRFYDCMCRKWDALQKRAGHVSHNNLPGQDIWITMPPGAC